MTLIGDNSLLNNNTRIGIGIIILVPLFGLYSEVAFLNRISTRMIKDVMNNHKVMSYGR